MTPSKYRLFVPRSFVELRSANRSYEDNVRRTCSDLVHDVVVLCSNRPFTCMFVEALDSNFDGSSFLELAKEVVRRNAAYTERLFLYERVDDPSHIYILKKGSLPRTKVCLPFF